MIISFLGAIVFGGMISVVLNRCIVRMPNDLPLAPALQCPSCQKSFSWKQRIPVVGYVVFRPYCGECNTPRPFQTIVIDILTILSTILLVYWRQFTPLLMSDLLFVYALILISIIDWNDMIIEPRIIVLVITARIIWLLAFSVENLTSSITGMLVGAGAFYFIAFIYETLRHRKGLGDGDAAVLGMIGLWVGWEGLPLVVLIGALSGLIVGVAIILTQKKSLSQTQIPFAPFLCMGGLTVYLLQELPHIRKIMLTFLNIG